MREEWKNVVGFEHRYEISDHGNVRTKSLPRRVGRKDAYMSKSINLKPQTSRNGYAYVNLWKDEQHHHKYVHRLVAEAFIKNREGKPQVNHLDGEKMNNCVSNLEWATPFENVTHSTSTNLNKAAKTAVSQYELDGRYIKSFLSISDASKITGIYYSSIRSAAGGYHKSAGGFLWRKDNGSRDDLIIDAPIPGVKDGKKRIFQYSLDGDLLGSYESLKAAQDSTGISFYALSKCANGVNKTSGGFLWSFTKKESV